MGNLKLNCVTADASGQTLYGLTIASNYSSPYSSQDAVILVEAKVATGATSHSNHKDLTWSVISLFITKYDLFYGGSASSFVCAISSTGVFTFFTESVLTSPTTQNRPAGFQYNPTETMEASFGYTGKGAWRNLTVGNGVNWEYPYKPLRLFYTNAVAVGGDERLVFVMADTSQYYTYGLRFGVVDAVKNSLEYAGSWSWPSSTYGEPKGIAQAGDELYLYSIRNYNPLLTAFSLKTLNTTEPVAIRTYNATSTKLNCDTLLKGFLHTAVYKGTYYLACGEPPYAVANFRGGLFTIKDILTNTTSFTPKVDVPYRQLESEFFIPVGGSTPGVAPFAYLQSQGVARSIVLDGTQAGIIHDGTNVTIAETYGQNPNPIIPNTNYNNGNGDGKSGGIIGVIAGAFFLIIMVLLCIRLGKKVNAQARTGHVSKPQQEPPGTPHALHMHQESFGQGGPNSFGHPSHQMPPAPSGSFNIQPMAPITSVTTQPLHTFQDQMLGLQFSSHPRPNFVTTGATEAIGYEQEQLSSPGASTSAASTTWQPTPFVPPPTRSSDPTGTGTTSTSVNTSNKSNMTLETTSAVFTPQVLNATRPQAP
ncbi:hypothetical protein BGX24_000332 [Mortierella sp. AD032]|nr:hypothetical protein BGX24_000332 [Mortierella sp. AD032]